MKESISVSKLPLLTCKTCGAECQNIYIPDRTLTWISLHSRYPHVLDNTIEEINIIKDIVIEQIKERDKKQ
jgi:hypothetical protein